MLQCEQLAGGMTKILEASEAMKQLSAKLEIQKVAVAKKTAACEHLHEDIKGGNQYQNTVDLPTVCMKVLKFKTREQVLGQLDCCKCHSIPYFLTYCIVFILYISVLPA